MSNKASHRHYEAVTYYHIDFSRQADGSILPIYHYWSGFADTTGPSPRIRHSKGHYLRHVTNYAKDHHQMLNRLNYAVKVAEELGVHKAKCHFKLGREETCTYYHIADYDYVVSKKANNWKDSHAKHQYDWHK